MEAGVQQYIDNRAVLTRSTRAATRTGAMGRRFVPRSLRDLTKTAATRAIEPQQRRRALKLQQAGLTRLHLGCGATHLDGWLNIDLFGNNADAFLDLRRRLPFADNSIDAAFHEHLIEHLPYAAALRFATECCRVLRPGGILRMAMPDFRRYAESYLSNSGLIDEKRPDRPSRLLAFSEVFYEHGHLSMWDADTLQQLTAAAGFTSFAVSGFGESALGGIDSPSRELESLYVEATK